MNFLPAFYASLSITHVFNRPLVVLIHIVYQNIYNMSLMTDKILLKNNELKQSVTSTLHINMTHDRVVN